MQTDYIYSANRAKTLLNELLKPEQVEKLCSAGNESELEKLLKDTYLAEYISTENTDAITTALQNSVLSAKEMVMNIAPDPRLLEIFWLRYDFFNLRVIVKAERLNLNTNETLEYCSKLGKHDPKTVIEYAKEDKLNRLEASFPETYLNAKREIDEGRVSMADIVIDKAYFKEIHNVSWQVKDDFTFKAVRMQIDLYNLKNRLRSFPLEKTVHIEGGSYSPDELDIKEQVIDKLMSLGGEKFWQEAVDDYLENGHTTLLDKKMDDHLLNWVRSQSINVFSVAPLVQYFLQTLHTAKLINTLLVGKKNGWPVGRIRANLRQIYG